MLNEVEVRVLGSLIEKQVMTPEYYPLTLNALTQACNQKNNREPVVSFDEATVAHALETLRVKNLVYVFYGSGSRVPKYKHMTAQVYELDEREQAVIDVLMLRGQQTIGELRERANRLCEFSGAGVVEETLNTLMNKEPNALVMKLPRQAGQKDARYAHLLSGEVIIKTVVENSFPEVPKIAGTLAPTQVERIAKLEGEVEVLGAELKTLREQFDDFKSQFG
ncbi:MAG: YceH family protein [Pyrinomonadaceae bacterium MAG19_C2-C3]|nr:YceH family protein [Pyrinomonadaceae bacterium MAG19_C2-C3]